jgi:hypothetical protein
MMPFETELWGFPSSKRETQCAMIARLGFSLHTNGTKNASRRMPCNI